MYLLTLKKIDKAVELIERYFEIKLLNWELLFWRLFIVTIKAPTWLFLMSF